MKVTDYSNRVIRRILQILFSFLALAGWLPVAQGNWSNSSMVQQRIENVRQRLLALDSAEPRPNNIDHSNPYIAQWYNWPNWPNWGNWGNWPNYWMNY